MHVIYIYTNNAYKFSVLHQLCFYVVLSMPSCVVLVYCLWIGNEFTFRNQKIKEKEEGFGGGQVKMYNSKVGLLNLFTQLWKYIENILNFTYSGSVLLLLKDAWRRSIDWNVVFFFILKSDFWQQCANLFFPHYFQIYFFDLAPAEMTLLVVLALRYTLSKVYSNKGRGGRWFLGKNSKLEILGGAILAKDHSTHALWEHLTFLQQE